MVMIDDDGLARLRGRLRAAHGLRPVRAGQERAFWLHDLASTVEAAFGEVVGYPDDGWRVRTPQIPGIPSAGDS
jgi:hypothetical protein